MQQTELWKPQEQNFLTYEEINLLNNLYNKTLAGKATDLEIKALDTILELINTLKSKQ